VAEVDGGGWWAVKVIVRGFRGLPLLRDLENKVGASSSAVLGGATDGEGKVVQEHSRLGRIEQSIVGRWLETSQGRSLD
jgi:hypothetical protein